MQWKGLFGSIAMALSAVLALPAVAAPVQAAPVSVDPCQSLDGRDFSRTRDAPFTITAAKTTTENVPQPYCKVTGYVIPEISFEMRLPLAGWNHGFVLVGSGGWAINKFTFLCRGPLAKGYACIAGDGGHQFNDGLWMQSNAQAKIDWGYRATHVVALAGKELVEAFYGAPPTISLMLGGSTGGYQGLVEAQRFPWDFNGIVAVAPDIDEADLSMRTAWAARHLVGDDGKHVFAEEDLAVLHAGALRACDLSDGLRDGIIGDPMACRFDPRSVQCKSDGGGHCLTPRQVAAAAAIYGGPTTSGGQPISTGGPFPGSEMGWYDILEDVKFAEKFFRFALTESPLDGFAASKFNYDEDYKRLGLAGTMVSSNPDLRKFAQAGGKLLIVQGTNDVTEQSRAAIDYYQMVERVMGGAEATRRFARLFLIPGMNHVTGGDGAGAIDYLAAIEEWVLRKSAPELLVGSHVPDWTDRSFVEAGLTGPTSSMKVTFTRPSYPFPLHARYKGHGDVNDARNFAPSAR